MMGGIRFSKIFPESSETVRTAISSGKISRVKEPQGSVHTSAAAVNFVCDHTREERYQAWKQEEDSRTKAIRSALKKQEEKRRIQQESLRTAQEQEKSQVADQIMRSVNLRSEREDEWTRNHQVSRQNGLQIESNLSDSLSASLLEHDYLSSAVTQVGVSVRSSSTRPSRLRRAAASVARNAENLKSTLKQRLFSRFHKNNNPAGERTRLLTSQQSDYRSRNSMSVDSPAAANGRPALFQVNKRQLAEQEGASAVQLKGGSYELSQKDWWEDSGGLGFCHGIQETQLG